MRKFEWSVMSGLFLGIVFIIIMLFICSCDKGKSLYRGEPEGAVVIFIDNLILSEFSTSENDVVTIFFRFRELAGLQTEVMCLMPKFMKDGSFLDQGYFAPCVDIPRFGEISYIQKMTIFDSRDADILRVIIQCQTENFKGFSVTKDFNLNLIKWGER